MKIKKIGRGHKCHSCGRKLKKGEYRINKKVLTSFNRKKIKKYCIQCGLKKITEKIGELKELRKEINENEDIRKQAFMKSI